MNRFQTALNAFLSHIQGLGLGYNDDRIKPDTFGHSEGRAYVRVFRCYHGDPSNRSAFCFIRLVDGAILKPDGWKRPAKHARGSIYDPSSWGCVSRYGIASLR